MLGLKKNFWGAAADFAGGSLPRRPAAWPQPKLMRHPMASPVLAAEEYHEVRQPIEVIPPPTIVAAPLALPPAERMRASDFQRRQHLLVAQTNRDVKPGCQVLAWAIVPPELFTADMGRFLLFACDFHVHSPANTMLLPTMPMGADQLSLPRHPLVTLDLQRLTAESLLRPLRLRVADELRRASQALARGDTTQLFTRTERQAAYRLELGNIVRDIAITCFGVDVWQRHEKTFRSAITAM